MNQNDIIIRLEQAQEQRDTETLVREAFWNVYRPGCCEHYLLHVLREDADFVPQLNLVMEQGGRLIGQAAFVKAVIAADDGRSIPVLTMGPVSIAPDRKGQGLGKRLLEYALAKAAGLDFGAVLIEGNIGFYGKAGFGFARNFGIRYHGLPKGEDDSFFLCRELIPGFLDGITGEYRTPSGYFVEETSVDAFDRDFPFKEKLKLPGQLF